MVPKEGNFCETAMMSNFVGERRTEGYKSEIIAYTSVKLGPFLISTISTSSSNILNIFEQRISADLPTFYDAFFLICTKRY